MGGELGECMCVQACPCVCLFAVRVHLPTSTLYMHFKPPPPFRQWLPPDKIEPLGVNSEHDAFKITQSGSSKRSVKEAFQRAKHYQRRMASRLKSINTSEPNIDTTEPFDPPIINATDAEIDSQSDT